ncbi:MAG: DUF222 domain-containing protein [Solirubrobacterales bacterium]|nr:DUF222 domain-containing protein [Solirubrobacterales bacterium]
MFWDVTERTERTADSPEPLSTVPLELIEREIESLAAQINAGCARWLELVAEFDRREGWGDTGCRSISEWIAWRCALNPRSAREHVRVARALPDLPRIRAAFASGALSYSKVRALTWVADGESEAELLELARHATAAQLERVVRAAHRVSAAEADEAQSRTFVRWCWDDDDGCLRLDARLSPEDGALFLRALESARDAVYERREDEGGSAGPLAATGPSGSAEPPEPPAARPVPSPTNAESLAALAEAALARPPTGLPGGERYQLLVHVDAETLATDEPGATATGRGACAIADGPAISPETARRLACDSSLVTISERDGEPVAVGRRRRSIPPSVRRALVARDGRCQFPGCERWRFVDAHHIRHWAHGGETGLSNLVLLCRHHHRLVHEAGFSLALDADGRRRFARPDGSSIPVSPLPPPVDRAELPPARAPTLTGTGEKVDLGMCVDAVLVAGSGPRTPETAGYAERSSSCASS